MYVRIMNKEPLSRISVQLPEADRPKLIALKGQLQLERRTLKDFVLEAIWEKADRERGKKK